MNAAAVILTFLAVWAVFSLVYMWPAIKGYFNKKKGE